MRLPLPFLCSASAPSRDKRTARSTRKGLILAALAAFICGITGSAVAQGLVLDPTITTYAGTGSLTNTNSGNGGQATAAGLNNPEGIAYDSRGNTYISDYYNNTIRIVNSAGVISAFAGTGAACPAAANAACGDGGAASAALFHNPSAMQFDSLGDLYIADYGSNRIRKIIATNGVITPASIVTTVAGTGAGGAGGAGGPATAALLNTPHGLALDAGGDLWIANQQGGCYIDYVPATAQTITIGGTATALTPGDLYVVAGTGTCGGGGTGTVGVTTQLYSPTNIALDSANNLYIGDFQNGKVRKLVTTTGLISTVAGTTYQACPVAAPTQGQAPAATPLCGDGGPATAAALNGPTGVFIDGSGNIIIGDAFGARVREVYGPNSTAGTPGNITTIAGTSQQCTNISQNTTFSDGAGNILNFPNCGDGGPATQALVSFPILTSVNPQGNILYVDQYDNKIREINENIVFPPTNVGTSSTSQNINVQTTGAGTTTITSITSSSAQFTLGTTAGCTIGTAAATGTVCTTPITFTPAYPGIQTAVITYVTSAGTFSYGVVGTGVAPQAVISPGILSTVAGTGAAGFTNAAATASTLNTPTGPIAFDSLGDYFIADTANNVVRKVTAATGVMSTFAGTGTAGNTGDNGQATAATLNKPAGVALDAAGDVYIADSGNGVIRKVSTTGVITTFIGGLTTPSGIAVNPITQALYIADAGANTVRQYSTATGTLTTVVGTGTACTPTTAACGDGGVALAANLNKPTGVTFDVNGNLWIADSGDNRVREVTASNSIINTIVGTGAAGYAGDGAAALSATLSNPSSLVLDAAGDVYITDQANNVVRFVGGGTNNISTLAGNGTVCTTVPSPACGDGGLANVSAFDSPRGVALDNSGDLFVTETLTNRIREVAATGTALSFATTPVAATSTDSPKTATLENIGNAALTLTAPTVAGALNPSISAGFTDGNTATCPQLSNGSANGSLASGSQCTYLVSFTPTSVGTSNGQLVESDNSLYVASTQTVSLNGTGVPANATAALTANPGPTTTYGTPVTLTETIAPINGTCPAGPATFFTGTTQLGTGAITLVNGSCVATLTTANLPVGNDALKATVPASGDFTATTSLANETVNKAPVTNTPALAALSQTFVASTNPATNPTTTAAGGTVSLTYTVPAVTGNAPPTGPVVFSSPGLATPITCTTFTAGTPVAATATVPAYTPYSCTSTTTALAVGNPDVVTATYNANDPNYANAPALTQNVIVTAAAATTTLIANPTPSTYGTPVTLTETIAPINGTCPAGPATFFTGTTQLGTGAITLVNGSCIATLTTANLPVGTDALKATVPASGNFAAITTNGTTTVTKAPVMNTPALAALSQTFVASTNPATNPTTTAAGGTVTLTYTVPAVTGNTPPTGPVVFSSPGLATPITCTTFTAGTPVAATATVPAYTPYSCTSTTTALAVGNPDVVTATYNANDPNYANAPALTQNVIVTAAAATTTLIANPTPSTYGTPVTLTETIAPINGTCPAGPATFFTGTTQLGTGAITLVNGSCIATLTTANLPVGTDALKATVPASGNFAAITTNGTTTVTKAPVMNTPALAALSQTFVASTNPATNPTTTAAGGTVTLTYTVPAVTGNTPPTGPVVFSSPGLATPITCTTFTAGTPVAATATVPAYTPYSCTSTTTALAVGNPDVVTATYNANDPNYANAPALTQNVIVTAAAATTTLIANPTPSTYGTPVTLTETIAPINGTCPAGPATFFTGTTQLGTGAITLVNGSCIATLTTANLPVGMDALKATVPASGNFAAITTNGTTTVTKAPVMNGTTPVLSQSFVASTNPGTSPTTSPAGGTVILTYTIPVAAGNVAPTGPVVFSSPGLATPITCSNFVAGAPVAGTTPPYTPYSCTSTTTALAVGNPDLVTATYTATDPNYANAPALTQNVIVTPVTPGNVITVPPTTPACGTSVTLTDTITPVNGIPVAGGTVQFYDNGVPVGGLIVVPTSGVVTLTTTTLNCGPNVITSIYTPPAGSPYLPAPGGPVNFGVAVADFTIAATPPNQVVNPGATVVYTIALAGATVPFTSPVTLTATGLPAGATLSFGQATYVPGQGPTTTTMTIVTSPLHSELRGYPGMGGGSKIAFGLLLLPLLGVRRIRRKLKALPRGVMYGLTALLLLAGLGAVTGCGGGYIGPNPGFYTITVTGTSGTLVHSTTVQLEVR